MARVTDCMKLLKQEFSYTYSYNYILASNFLDERKQLCQLLMQIVAVYQFHIVVYLPLLLPLCSFLFVVPLFL